MNRFRIEVADGRMDLGLCVSSGQVFRWQRLTDGSWLGVDGDSWFRVTGDGPFEVESNAGTDDFRSMFRLDWDAGETIREILACAPELGPSVDGLPGLRLLRRPSAEETLFSFLCTPNNHMNRIVPMVRHLASRGRQIDEVAGEPIFRFPSAGEIADIPESDLRSNGFGYRAATIPRAARQVEAKGPGWLDGLKSLPYLEAQAELCGIDGIGPKLADCICLFGLDQTESAPVDTHLWQALTRLYFPNWAGKAVTDQRYRAAGEFLRGKFGRLTGWAHQYLFYENLLRRRDGR